MHKTKMLEEFHTSFGIEKPNKINAGEYSDFLYLRLMLMREEYEEFRDAMDSIQATLGEGMMPTMEQKAELMDAMADMDYINTGTSQLLGWDLDGAFNEVHESNMSKLDENGKPIVNGEGGVVDDSRPLGKVLKSSKFREPNLKPFVKDKETQLNLDI